MTVLLRPFVALLLVMAPSVAFAQAAKAIRFADEKIQGEVPKPTVVVEIRGQNLNPTYVLELRESFLPKVIQSVNQKPF